MNKYRVDRNKSADSVPCGMNSLIHLGDSFNVAKDYFRKTTPGLDTRGQPNLLYGVTLAAWDESELKYVIKMSKYPDLIEEFA